MKINELTQLITRYLLGESSAAENEFIEGKYASDPDFLSMVESIEDDLIDRYVRNQLSSTQSEQFEAFFLESLENRDKVKFATALMRNFAEQSRNEPSQAALLKHLPVRVSHIPKPVLAFSLIAIVVTIFGISWWLVYNRIDSQQGGLVSRGSSEAGASSPTPSVTSGSTSDRGQKSRPSNQDFATSRGTSSRKGDQNPSVILFVLNPGITRTNGISNTIEIPKNARLIALQLNLDSNVKYKNYRASLRMIGGPEIWTTKIKRNQLRHQGRSVILNLAANLLSKNDYLLTLTGFTAAGQTEISGDYFFRVVRKDSTTPKESI